MAAFLVFFGTILGSFYLGTWLLDASTPERTVQSTPQAALDYFLSNQEARRRLQLVDTQLGSPAMTTLASGPGLISAAAVARGEEGPERVLFASLWSERQGWRVVETHSVCLGSSASPGSLLLVPFPTQPLLVYRLGGDPPNEDIRLDDISLQVAERDGPFATLEGPLWQTVPDTVNVYIPIEGSDYRLDERESCG